MLYHVKKFMGFVTRLAVYYCCCRLKFVCFCEALPNGRQPIISFPVCMSVRSLSLYSRPMMMFWLEDCLWSLRLSLWSDVILMIYKVVAGCCCLYHCDDGDHGPMYLMWEKLLKLQHCDDLMVKLHATGIRVGGTRVDAVSLLWSLGSVNISCELLAN